MINIHQKFKRGDVVHICKMGGSMAHFDGDVDAIVMGSYSDLCRGHTPPDGESQYQVMFDTGCTCAWYYEKQLTFKGHASELEIERLEKKFKDDHS